MPKLPLGLKVDPQSKILLMRLAKIEDYDFSGISADIKRKLRWTPRKIAKTELEVRRFFSLAMLDPGYYHIPEVDVDDYWHRMILHTVWYTKFCKSVFGGYFDHTPEPDPDHLNQRNRERTVKVVSYWYGSKWPKLVKTCTQCNHPTTLKTLPKPAKGAMPRF
ncbi:MAG: hypothetical protein AB7I36_17885 [Rhodospirillaceae bacterium]